MAEIRKTTEFDKWFRGLKDLQTKGRIRTRIDRLALGLPGDAKPVREGISELRIDTGPGYRIYFTRKSACIIFLLAGGTKGSQDNDIKKAIELARHI